MTKSEIDLIRRAVALLHSLIPGDEFCTSAATPRRSPVVKFAGRYLTRQPGADMSATELWTFYAEVAAAGELDPLTRQEFLRALPGAMAAVFGVNKCHSIQREGRTVRGFKSVTIRDPASPVVMLEIEPEAV